MSKTVKIRYSPTKDTFLRISGMKVRVRRRPGKGIPLLLINGLGACIEAWEPLTTRLPGHHIIAIDHPGTGLSSPPNRILSMTDLAEFYIEALNILGVQRAHVLGFSFGGTIAQQMAKDFPDRVHSLILAGTAVGWGGFPPDPMTLIVAANPLRYQIPIVREMAAPVIYRGHVGRHPRLFETELAGWDAHRSTLLGVGAQVAAFIGWSSMPWLATLDVPTLVMCGEEDPMAPVANSKLIASIIPGAELEIYDEAGHLFLFDTPAAPAARIDAFLGRVRVQAVA